MKKHKQRNLFALCIFAAFIATSCVFIKTVDIIRTDIDIEKAQADVRALYKDTYTPIDAPTISGLQTQNKAGRVLVITQVRN